MRRAVVRNGDVTYVKGVRADARGDKRMRPDLFR